MLSYFLTYNLILPQFIFAKSWISSSVYALIITGAVRKYKLQSSLENNPGFRKFDKRYSSQIRFILDSKSSCFRGKTVEELLNKFFMVFTRNFHFWRNSLLQHLYIEDRLKERELSLLVSLLCLRNQLLKLQRILEFFHQNISQQDKKPGSLLHLNIGNRRHMTLDAEQVWSCRCFRRWFDQLKLLLKNSLHSLDNHRSEFLYWSTSL